MKVAVIGAGLAGLSAAQELNKRGAQVKVFEKARGLGGRLTTKRLDWGTIDIGAQYFTVRDEQFQKQVARWLAEGVVSRWEFAPHTLSSSGLTTRASKAQRFVGIPGMNSLAHALAQDIDTRFSTRIETLTRSDEGWQLQDANGETISGHFDWVVTSMPAEQSKILLVGSDLEQHIPDDVHEPCWALALATRGHVPTEIQGIFGDDIVSWVSRLSSRPKAQTTTEAQTKPEAQIQTQATELSSKLYDDLWMLHFSSEWSKTHNKDTSIDIAQYGLEWLSTILKQEITEPLELVHSYQHYWRYARLHDSNLKPSLLLDRTAGLAAIGGWAGGGKVEGAYLSGLKLAQSLLPD